MFRTIPRQPDWFPEREPKNGAEKSAEKRDREKNKKKNAAVKKNTTGDRNSESGKKATSDKKGSAKKRPDINGQNTKEPDSGNGKTENKTVDPGKLTVEPPPRRDDPETPSLMRQSLAPAFRYHVLQQLTNLEFRHFDAVREADAVVQKMELGPAEKDVLKRLELVTRAMKFFWSNVVSQADRIPGGTEIRIPGRKDPLSIVEADKTKVVIRYSGTNRVYYTNLMPNLVAESFLAARLGNRSTDYNMQVNVFRALHELRVQGNIDAARGELRKLFSQTADASPIFDFFDKDWPRIVAKSNPEIPPRSELNEVKEFWPVSEIWIKRRRFRLSL